jgi:hypothetical protein
VYLPRGWPARFWQQFQLAQDHFGKIGIAGVYGVASENGKAKRTGHIVDRDRLLKDGHEFPTRVQTLDELLLAVPKDAPIRFDPRLGFHFYGADACLIARKYNLAAVVLDAIWPPNETVARKV